MPSVGEDLRRQLNAEVPPSIAALPEGDLETLTRLLHDARIQQRNALEHAIDEGLSFLPRMMRGVVKRALGA
jgi:hypothetical protein